MNFKRFFFPLLVLVCASSLYAQSRSDLRIGVGGLYSSYDADIGGRDFTATGGYLTFVGRGFSADGRFWSEGGTDGISFASLQEKDSSSNKTLYRGAAHIKYGVNIASQNAPIYLGVGYSWDLGTQRFADSMQLRHTMHLVGLDLQGFIYGNGKMSVEYNVGYWYPFYIAYTIDDAHSRIKDYSYIIKAHIGFSYKLSEKLAYFMNLKAKYDDWAKTATGYGASYPKTQNLTGMVEIGLQF